DLEVIEKRLQKIGKNVSGNKEAAAEASVLTGLKAHLESGKPALSFDAGSDELNAVADGFSLLTRKHVIYAANVSEDDVSDDGANNSYVSSLKAYAEKEGAPVFVVSAELEAEIADFEDEEKQLFLEDLGVRETALNKLIQASYSILGLTSYLTAGEKETRAWTIRKGTKAPEAAGKIHSDFERGFIKAEVVNYRDLLDAGSYAGAREKGLVRMEGKEYVVQDGDVILFRFNV
ncbi:MAG: DUF933 domain-containing protein, partial [Lachnospiraceae bacterium]|nr:DUF933 domain-containing protein [Lachnospiraceae bacterium]